MMTVCAHDWKVQVPVFCVAPPVFVAVYGAHALIVPVWVGYCVINEGPTVGVNDGAKVGA